MSLEGIESKIKLFFPEYIFKAYKINKKTKKCIGTTRSGIAKGLQVHQLPERRVKKINQWEDKISCTMYMPFHAVAKVTETNTIGKIPISNRKFAAKTKIG